MLQLCILLQLTTKYVLIRYFLFSLFCFLQLGDDSTFKQWQQEMSAGVLGKSLNDLSIGDLLGCWNHDSQNGADTKFIEEFRAEVCFSEK